MGSRALPVKMLLREQKQDTEAADQQLGSACNWSVELGRGVAKPGWRGRWVRSQSHPLKIPVC
jgi:hypothetical protein